MAGSSLRAISASFLSGLAKTSGSSYRSKTSLTQLLNGGALGSNTSDLSGVLRKGAKLFARSVEDLNGTASLLNLSRSALSELGEITDDLIGLAQQAAKSGTSNHRRKKLQKEMEALGNDFNEVLRKAKIGTSEALNTEDLENVFQKIGLDPNQSSAVAEVFSKFILADGDSNLASASIQSSGRVQIAPDAFGTAPYTTTELSPGLTAKTLGITDTVLSGFVTQVNSIYNLDGAGVDQPEIVSEGDTIGTLAPNTLSADITVYDHDPTTGYSLISSSNELLWSGDGGTDLFLVDNRGDVIHRYTTFDPAEGSTITDAALDDNYNVIYSVDHVEILTSEVVYQAIDVLGGDPSAEPAASVIKSENATGVLGKVAINDEGTYLAFYDAGKGGVTTTNLEGTVSQSLTVTSFEDMGFVGGIDLAISSSDSSGNVGIYSVEDGSELGSYSGVGINATSFTALEETNQFAVLDQGGELQLLTYSEGEVTEETWSVIFGEGDNVKLSLAADKDGNTEIGYVLDMDSEGDGFYRISSSSVEDGTQISAAFEIPTYGGISTVNNVFSTKDNHNYNNYNSGFVSLITQSEGSTTFTLTRRLDQTATVLAVDEASGMSLVETTDDLLGYNSGGYSQLFLVDAAGNAIHQMTNNTVAGAVYESADFDPNGLAAVGELTLGPNTILQLWGRTGALNSDPAGIGNSFNATVDLDATGALEYSNIKISDGGTHIAYMMENTTNGDSVVRFYNIAGAQFDTTIQGQLKNEMFDFIDNDTIAVLSEKDGVQSISTYQWGSGEYNQIIYDLNDVTELQATQKDGDGEYSILFHDEAISSVKLWRENTTTGEVSYDTVLRYDSLQDTPGGLSIADKDTFGISGEFGIFSGSGSTEDELYRTEVTSVSVDKAGDLVSRATPSYEGVFDSKRSLLDRPGAMRLLGDLKALKEQIDNNIDVLDSAIGALQDNISLLRSSGEAFLNLSEQISSADRAIEVADKLQSMIRSDADRAALAQAENLTSLTVAALLNED